MAKRQDEAAVMEAGWRAIRAVDGRAQRCPHPACRRARRCAADPWRPEHWRGRSGGCPVTRAAEWAAIRRAIDGVMGRAFAAVDAVRRETGEEFQTACERLLTDVPRAAWTRHVMMRLMRGSGR